MRAYLPIREGGAVLARALENMGAELTGLLGTPETQDAATRVLGLADHPAVETYNVGEMVSAGPVYRVAAGLSVVQQAGRELLSNGRDAVEIPPGLNQPVRWVVNRPEITEASLAAAFPGLDQSSIEDLMGKLRAMSVLL